MKQRVDGLSQVAEYKRRIEESGELVYQQDAVVGISEQPLVSIITQTLNSEKTIEAAIESVRRQTYPNIEHIVVDGISTDGTFDLVLKNKALLGAILRGKDCNPGDAFNKGFAICRGEFVCILPSDDTFEPSYVENAISVMLRTGCDFAYGDLVYSQQGRAPLLVPGERDYTKRILYTMPNMSAITLMHRRDAFERVGLMDISNRYCPDYDWLLRAHLVGLKGSYDPSIRATFSHGGISSINYFAAIARGRDVAISHGGPVLMANWSYWRGVLQKRVRDLLQAVLPSPIFHAILRRMTRTGTRPVEDCPDIAHQQSSGKL